MPGQLEIFSNVTGGQFTDRPNTILVDSEQLESGDAMSADFKKIAAREIDEFKADYRRRFPGSDPDKLTDEDLLREVLNTVGKPGKLGEHVKCVVSVSMLTEGSDLGASAAISIRPRLWRLRPRMPKARYRSKPISLRSRQRLSPLPAPATASSAATSQ